MVNEEFAAFSKGGDGEICQISHGCSKLGFFLEIPVRTAAYPHTDFFQEGSKPLALNLKLKTLS